jgi:hypothetical protein
MDKLVEAFSCGKSGRIPDVLLTQNQRDLFHGFDEIGGDITMYEDAVEWYNSTGRKVEALYCCIIILDKPTSWLFGGISNEVKKQITSGLGKIAELRAEYDASTSDDVKNSIRAKILAQISLNDYLEIDNNGSSITIVAKKKSTLDSVLTRSMSLFTDSDIESFDEEQLKKMIAVRMWWQGDMSLVNVSRMKRVALMYLELCSPKKMITPGVKWIKNHGGKPSSMKNYGKNEQTKIIMKSDVENFMKNKSYWKDHKDVFNVKVSKDSDASVTGDNKQLTTDMEAFKAMCAFPTFTLPDADG